MPATTNQPGRHAAPELLADPAWAWAPYQPDAARPWDLRQAGHLCRRAAFGANWDQLQQALADGPQSTLDNLLHPKTELAALNRAYDGYENAAATSANTDGLRAWWLRRMIETPHPLLEQMTLFWHNHFAISNVRVNSAALMCRYVQLLRRHALGQFDALLAALVSEPAVLAGLDARANRKARPSENFPRVLLEQFTLGPGRFSETDVRETARAFTGWFVSQNQPLYLPREHDPGAKRLLGEEGNFEGKDVVRILLRQPATSQLVVRQLYRWFISETTPPTQALIAPLAADFAKDFNVQRLVETLLRSNLFFSPAAYRQKVKSPVALAVGLVRCLDGTVGTVHLGADLADLGQDLCQPPTSKGWAGSRCWINRFTLLGRARLAQALFAGSGPYEGKLDPFAAAARHLARPDQTAAGGGRFLLELFLQADLAPEVRQAVMEKNSDSDALSEADRSVRLRHAAALLAALPEFQLA